MALRKWFSRQSRRTRSAHRLSFESFEDRTLMAVDFSSIVGLGVESGSAIAVDIKLDAAGNSYITGYLDAGSIDFDPFTTYPGNVDVVDVSQGPGFIVKYASDGTFQWARPLAADVRSLALDAAGNAFVAGYYSDTTQFGGIVLAKVNNLYADAFVVKIDATGEFVWAKGHGGLNSDIPADVAVDPTGRFVYLLARTDRTVGSGPGSALDIMVTKFDAANPANVVTNWSVNLASSWNWTLPGALAVDASGNVLATGVFQGTADFDPGSGKLNLSSGVDKSTRSAFVWKLNSNGGLVWAKNFENNATSTSWGRDIAIDPAGNVVVAGTFSGQPDFDPGKAKLNLAFAGGSDVFVVKLTASGNLIWGHSFGGPGNETPYDLVIDSAGGIFIAGSFAGGADFDPGPGSAVRTGGGAFVTKLSASGSFDWVAVAVATGSAYASGLAISPLTGQVHVVGRYSGALNTDPDPNPVLDELFDSDLDIFWWTLNPS